VRFYDKRINNAFERGIKNATLFSRPYLSNGRAIDMVVVRRLSVCPSVTDVPWLTGKS